MENDNIFAEALYKGVSIPDAVERYERALRTRYEQAEKKDEKKNLLDLAHAGKMEEYRKQITNTQLLYRLRKHFNQIYKLIDTTFPEVHFVIDGRRKSLTSYEKKVLKLFKKRRSLDSLRDTFAFRIILFGNNSMNLVNLCYHIANTIIEFCFANGLKLCDSEVTSETEEFKKDKHPNILIPPKSLILKDFEYGVKDYFIEPKENGYQSLHLIIRTKTGEYFEIQIRTFDMHLHAESGEANHNDYKKKKYKDSPLYFDPKKIQMPGYGISPEGKVFDFIGLEEGLEVLKRQKTF